MIRWTIIAGLVVAFSASATAQDRTPASTTAQATPAAAPTSTPENQWLASGFVGSNFGRNAVNPSTEFGGALGYLWHSKVGAEFDAGSTPNFQLQNNFFGLGLTPRINNYMVHAIGAFPFGPDRQWQPFVSGGVGAMNLRSNLADATRVGSDIGGGLMGFLGNFGFKADVRYFRTAGNYSTSSGAPTPSPTPSPTTPTPTPPPSGPYGTPGSAVSASAVASSPATAVAPPGIAPATLANNVLSGLAFWRANVGIAVRW